MSSSPRVTVLMAVHNGIPYLDRAVTSILSQSFRDFEFLIVDDGSSDGSADAILAYGDPRIRLVRNEANMGLTRSLNRGLAEARGELVARQDADDASHPNRLAAQVAFMAREPAVTVLGTQARIVDARGRTVNVAPWPKSTRALAVRWQLLFDSPLIHTSVMFRRRVIWEEFGGYNEAFTTSQDFELWSRVSAAGWPMRNLPDVLVDFRTHDESVSARYRLKSVERVVHVLRDNLVAQLGEKAIPRGWPDNWMRLNNPRLYPNAAEDWEEAAAALRQIRQRFTRRFPESLEDPEIRRHEAAMLVRIANAAAERRLLGSARPFLRSFRLDPKLAAHQTPRYLGHLLLGPLNNAARRQRQSKQHGRALVEAARMIYKATPSAAVRKIYFKAFCRVVRDRQMMTTVEGSTFELDLGEMIDLALYLGQYEPDVSAALRRYCRPGMTVFDIGANIGAHTLTLSRLVAPGGRVFAFEPTKFAFRKLRRNVALNRASHVHLVRAALSNQAAAGRVVDYRASWRTSGGRSDGMSVTDFLCLDDWAASNAVPHVDVIKIDIDGNEFEALSGGARLIERSHPVIVMEAVWPHFVDDSSNPFRWLAQFGYRFHDAKSNIPYSDQREISRLFPPTDRAMTVSFNVIALPPQQGA